MAKPGVCGTLLVGLGSPHGDDQAGWLVAPELARLGLSLPAITISSPADLLDHLDGLDCLLVCDACCGVGPPGMIHTWHWPALPPIEARFAGTHDLSLPAVLRIAESLGRLPPQVIIWGIEVERCAPASSPSPATHELARQVAAAIHAQPVSRRA